jgi:hypothetical protein
VPAQVEERGKNLQGIPVGLDLYFGGEEISSVILRGLVVYTWGFDTHILVNWVHLNRVFTVRELRECVWGTATEYVVVSKEPTISLLVLA